MSSIKTTPEKVLLIHEEPNALDAFRVKIKNTYDRNIIISKLKDVEKGIIILGERFQNQLQTD